MKIWTFKTPKDELLWETSVERFAEGFTQLLEERGIEYVVTIQEP